MKLSAVKKILGFDSAERDGVLYVLDSGNVRELTAAELTQVDAEVVSLEHAATVARAITAAVDKYKSALYAGVTYRGALFQSDEASLKALSETISALAAGWVLTAGFAWMDASNTPHAADIAFLHGLAAALADHKAALFAQLQADKAAARAL